MDVSLAPPGLHTRRDPTLDYPALAALLSAAHPERPRSAGELQRRDEVFLAGAFHAWWMVEAAGRTVAVADVAADLQHPEWARVFLSIHPQHDTPPLREHLWQLAELGLREMRASAALAHASEGWWELDFFRARGFSEHDRMWHSTLDLRAFDPAPFGAYLARARQAGIEVLPLSRFAWREEAIQRRLYALVVDLLADVPAATPFQPWPFDLWRERVLQDSDFDPDGVYLAVQGEEWLGLSELYRPDHARSGTLHQGLTGVRRHGRGHGAAWALKVQAAQAARARGWTAATTLNHQVNRAMLSINERMGYVKEPAWVELKRELG